MRRYYEIIRKIESIENELAEITYINGSNFKLCTCTGHGDRVGNTVARVDALKRLYDEYIAKLARLTNEELFILKLKARGFNNAQIGERLNYSSDTIYRRVNVALNKLE